MENREGPRIVLTIDCWNCKFLRSEYYACQSDTGYDRYYTHPIHDGEKYIRTTQTPDFCPLKEKALSEFIESINKK